MYQLLVFLWIVGGLSVTLSFYIDPPEKLSRVEVILTGLVTGVFFPLVTATISARVLYESIHNYLIKKNHRV